MNEEIGMEFFCLQNLSRDPQTLSEIPLYIRSVVVFLLGTFLLGSALLPSGLQAESKYFHLDPVMDSLAVGAGVTAAATTEWISSSLSPNLPVSLDKGSINPFDRSMMFSYSSALDAASDITQYSAIMYPLLLAIDVDASEYWTIGVLYVEALAISFSVKNALKLAFPRYRPYMYYPDPPERLISQKDYKDSFPSGHSTMAFTGASFFTYLYGLYHPDSPWCIPLSVGAYGLATATAVLRVTSGSHFVSDVLMGALIGSVSGFLVPYLHTKSTEEKNPSRQSVSIIPGINTISLMVRFRI